MKRDDRTQESFNYDAILEEIGEFGRYQLRTFIPLCFPALFFGVVIMSYTFTAAIPRYRYAFFLVLMRGDWLYLII